MSFQLLKNVRFKVLKLFKKVIPGYLLLVALMNWNKTGRKVKSVLFDSLWARWGIRIYSKTQGMRQTPSQWEWDKGLRFDRFWDIFLKISHMGFYTVKKSYSVVFLKGNNNGFK